MKSNLREHLLKCDNIPTEDEVKYIFRMIVDGVEHIHSKRLMHCDLKLENILVDYEENSSMTINKVYIADFGFCSRIKQQMTATERRGTIVYMAPELF